MVESKYSELRKYAWDYFSYHASQRLTTFHYYILISTLITTGYFIALQFIPVFAIILGVIIMYLSFIFWKLDCRNRELIRYSVEALEYIEEKDGREEDAAVPHVLNVFTRDLFDTKALRAGGKKWSIKKSVHYSTCFNMVFLSFSIIGAIGIAFGIYKLL